MQSHMVPVLLFAMLVHADDDTHMEAEAPMEAPMDVEPPVDDAVDQVWCQPGSADCTVFGDSNAVCVADANGLGKCECGEDFENPVTDDKIAHVCLGYNETTVMIRTTLMWRDDLCTSFSAAFEAELRAILLAVTNGSISGDLLPKCGSLTVFATVEDVDVGLLPMDLQAEIAAELASGNYSTVGPIGAPDSAFVTTSAGSCTVAHATATGVDTTGTCNAIECKEGFTLARATEEPTAPLICVANRTVPDDDDDSLPASTVVGVAIGCVFLAAILAGITVACRRRARTPYFEKDQTVQTHEMQDRV